MSKRDPYDLNKRLLENWRAHNEIPTLDELLGFGKNKSSGEPIEEYPASEFARLYRVLDDANGRLNLKLDRDGLYDELEKLITSQNFSIQEQGAYLTGNQLEFSIGAQDYPLLTKLFNNAGKYLNQLQQAFETAGIKIRGEVTATNPAEIPDELKLEPTSSWGVGDDEASPIDLSPPPNLVVSTGEEEKQPEETPDQEKEVVRYTATVTPDRKILKAYAPFARQGHDFEADWADFVNAMGMIKQGASRASLEESLAGARTYARIWGPAGKENHEEAARIGQAFAALRSRKNQDEGSYRILQALSKVKISKKQKRQLQAHPLVQHLRQVWKSVEQKQAAAPDTSSTDGARPAEEPTPYKQAAERVMKERFKIIAGIT